MSFLDKAGLTYTLQKLKPIIDKKANKSDVYTKEELNEAVNSSTQFPTGQFNAMQVSVGNEISIDDIIYYKIAKIKLNVGDIVELVRYETVYATHITDYIIRIPKREFTSVITSAANPAPCWVNNFLHVATTIQGNSTYSLGHYFSVVPISDDSAYVYTSMNRKSSGGNCTVLYRTTGIMTKDIDTNGIYVRQLTNNLSVIDGKYHSCVTLSHT